MQIIKLSQVGTKKIQIVMDTATGNAQVRWVDNQFGEEGAPCVATLMKMMEDMPNVQDKDISTAGYSDKDTSNTPDAGEKMETPLPMQQEVLQ